jgi:hypothetical protein
LRKPEKSFISRPEPVESFDDQDASPAERFHFRFRGREAQSAQELQAQILVLDAGGKVDAVGKLPNRRFENVSCSRSTARPIPFIVPA